MQIEGKICPVLSRPLPIQHMAGKNGFWAIHCIRDCAAFVERKVALWTKGHGTAEDVVLEQHCLMMRRDGQ